MAKLSFWKKAGIILLVCTAAAIAAAAQSFTTLHNSGTVAPLIEATDGNFYGTTLNGGATYGTVFQMTPAGELTTLYTFCAQTNCPDGSTPRAALVQGTDGNFYGTTASGGSYNNYGTVFQITSSGTLTTLHRFDGTDGSGPVAALIQATDGNFYGTTERGGVNNQGTVFRITPGGTLTTLYSFCVSAPCSDGSTPTGLIQGTDGNFYGITFGGGSTGKGTVFKITAAGALTTLYTFCSQSNCLDGQGPEGLVQASDGNFYGTTEYGGTSSKCNIPNYIYGCGTVFRMTPAGELTTLHSFCSLAVCLDGREPVAPLIQARDGNFYGTTTAGGWSSTICSLRCGTAFEITPGGTLAVVHDFSSTDGAYPGAALFQASDRSFYGTTTAGGASGSGTIFRLAVAPAVKLSTTSLGFGIDALNETSAARTVIVTNTGGAILTFKDFSTSGNFAISANSCLGTELPFWIATCRVSLTFAPTMLGKQTGTLTFTDNAADSPQTIQLSGIGVEPATLLPAAANYGTATVGTVSAPKVFTLTNNQSMTLSNISVSTTGDFAISATTCANTLMAKNKCAISVTFTPTTTGKRAGQLIVNDNASNNPQTSTLQGFGK
jgi:uncharacterized repeat protein (TIGR03803 family)